MSLLISLLFSYFVGKKAEWADGWLADAQGQFTTEDDWYVKIHQPCSFQKKREKIEKISKEGEKNPIQTKNTPQGSFQTNLPQQRQLYNSGRWWLCSVHLWAVSQVKPETYLFL